MPVRSKPSSEYVKKFRWNDSVKSASFTPTKEQTAPQAGLSSVDFADSFAITREPPLQRRRKPILVDNKMTYTTKQYMTAVNSDDSSDIGKPNKIPGSSLSKTFLKKAEIPRKTRQPIDKNAKMEKNKAIAAQTRIMPQPTQPPAPAKKQPPPSPTKVDKGPAVSKMDRHVRAGGDAAASKTKGKAEQETDVAMQYRAGIRARPGGPRFSSEYQRQFAWKQPSKESPLMAAEQMVHNSNANLAPYVPDKISRHTEYQRQFKQQNHNGPQDQLMQNAQQEIKAKYRVKTKSKRGKKLTPDKQQPAGVPSVISHDDPRLVKSSQNPQRPFFPHATVRKWRSEYKSNFKTPEIFSYENGVWKGADPPQVQPRDDSSETGGKKQEHHLTRSKSVGDLPNWFSEVLELRERARDYQKRSRGTHFSREHLAQLLANQARLWEETSTSSSTQTSGSEKKDEPKEEARPSASAPDLGHEPTRRKLAWHTNNNKAQEETNQNNTPVDRRSSISSVTTPETMPSMSSQSSDMDIEENGRLPTPTLKESKQTHESKRHHLDRTTPARGGALLTSPASRRKATHVAKTTVSYPRQYQTKPSSHTYVARSAPAKAIIPGGITKGFEYDSDDDDEDDLDRTLTHGQQTPPRNPAQQKQMGRFLHSSPSAGRRTSDPHPINEELSSPGFQRHSERFFETSPSMPTIPNKIEPPQTWAGPRAGLKTAPAGKGPLERPHSGSIAGRPQTAVPQTRQEASHQVQRLNSFMSPRSNGAESIDDWDLTPPRGGGRVRSDDELSLSTMSNASSSTLASEVLERAKKRRDDFWGKERKEKRD